MARLICGLWRLDGNSVDLERFDAMLKALCPAGRPWAHNQIIDGGMALAAVEIGTPVSPPVAPPLATSTRGFLAADVRLYGGVNSVSDEQQLAERLEQVGPLGLSDCHGDFAFAHWDRVDHRLTLGRDHFGVRPLQFTIRRGEYVAFASLPSAMLRTQLASRALDETVIASFPVNGQPLPGRTFFRDLQCVRAAHVVVIDDSGNANSRRYWRLALEPALPLDTDPMQSAFDVRSLLEQAVRRRLPLAGPAASHMSGGLDSTPIAILAARALHAEGRLCLAYAFQEARMDARTVIVDEAPYVAEAAMDEPNLQLRTIGSPGNFSLLSKGVDPDTMLPMAPDEPEEAVLADAAANGATIILSGWGGDQVVTSFGGGVESEMFWAGRWRDLGRELESRARRTGRSRWREFASQVVWRQLPARLRAYVRRQRGQDSWLDWARFVAPGKRPLVVAESRPQFPGSRENRRAELEAWWIPYRLEMFAQQGARHGITYAYPMLDLDLIRYAMRLPGTLFRREGVPRRLIRDAIEGIVPESVRWRQEKLAPYPAEALRIAEERKSMIEAFRELGKLPLVREYIDTEAVVMYLGRGRSAEQIRVQMADDASRGNQFTSDEEDHEFAMLLAFFLKAQDDLALNRS
jgi:asparagine synthase (glutamine-hydrolysing)